MSLSEYDPTSLLEQAAALQRLARRLVRDEARADDVVQETLVVALSTTERGYHSWPWLASVARNVARKMGREDTRRRAREERAARPESLPSVDELADRARTQRELADVLLSLEEPYRTALLYRYFEDLPPRRIAKALGAPVDTVHTWIRRGREQMRGKLDAAHGRDRWAPAFLVFAESSPAVVPVVPASAAAGAAGGGPAAGSTLGLLGAAACVVGITTFVLLSPGREGSGRPAEVALQRTGAVGLPEERGRTQRDDVDSSSRAQGEDPTAPEPSRSPSSDPSAVGPQGVRDASSSVAETGNEGAAPAPLRPTLPAPTYLFGPEATPPGLLPVKGGPTVVGTAVEEIQELSLEYPEYVATFAGETPQHVQDVAPFALMPTEVTNEQYLAFVEDTGHVPPFHWRTEASDEIVRRAARGGGVSEEIRVWRALAHDLAWDLERGEEDEPVRFVSWEDAQAYADWAGLRLMTEQEFQRAGRGASTRPFPWGSKWQPHRCGGAPRSGDGKVRAVGSHPNGAAGPFQDLVGSVFEWTSSAYLRFRPDEEAPVLSDRLPRDGVAAGPVGLPGFDPSYRVLAGGGFSTGREGCRLSSRMASPMEQRASALGFRCAASRAPSRDAAQALLRRQLASLQLDRFTDGGEIAFAPALAVGLLRWSSRPGSLRHRKSALSYRVIESFACDLFVPVRDLGRLEAPGKVRLLGLLSLAHPLREPELDAGLYLLAWRSAGAGWEEDAVDLELDGLLPGASQLIAYDPKGRPVAWFRDVELESGRRQDRESLGITIVSESRTEGKEERLLVSARIPMGSKQEARLIFQAAVDPGLLAPSRN